MLHVVAYAFSGGGNQKYSLLTHENVLSVFVVNNDIYSWQNNVRRNCLGHPRNHYL